MDSQEPSSERASIPWTAFLAGACAGVAALFIAKALWPRRGLDPSLFAGVGDGEVPPIVIVPGILGSSLLRPDGTHVWLNLGNAFGHYDLSLPLALPMSQNRDELIPGGLLGVDAVLPRLFGFAEYADLVDLLENAGFRRSNGAESDRLTHHVFTYDWRRDLVESAQALHATLEALAEARGNPEARFNVIGHSMGGLVARYYLRYGPADLTEDAEVSWAGARRIRNLILVATPNGGSIPALDAILTGNRVGLSGTTLAASVIARMPSIYQLLPPDGVGALLDRDVRLVGASLLDASTWERFGWGPYSLCRRRGDLHQSESERGLQRAFLSEALSRARAFHRALSRPPQTRCPVRVVSIGGDCLPTLARAIVHEQHGVPPRFEPSGRAEAAAMFEAGDGRVTRSSVLASHLPGGDEAETGSGIPEVSNVFFGSADHHGIYSEPSFQAALMRLLMRRVRTPSVPRAGAVTRLPGAQEGQL